MKVLVTGGAGFIGSHLVDAYINRGDTVAIIDDFSTGRKENVNPKAKVFNKTITRMNEVLDVMQRWKPDLVNHHAAHISVTESVKYPASNARINIIGSLNVFEAAKQYKVKRLIVASTGGALYGDAEVRPTPENAPLVPLSPYGLSKLTMEQYVEYYSQWMDAVILRYANVYGERQGGSAETGVIARFIQTLRDREKVTIYGDGKQTRDYVHVSDVVAANMLVSNEGDGIYNVGTGVETSVKDVYKLISERLSFNQTPYYDLPRNGEVINSSLDPSRIREELGWKPTTRLEIGIEKTIC